VPSGAKAAFAQKLAEMQSQWSGYDAYVMAHGERFEDVATIYGTSLAMLKKLNDVQVDSEIAGGTVIVVPRISVEQREKNRAKAKAKLLGSGVDQRDGEPLIVAIPDKDAKVPGKKRVFYRVVSGDSVRDVAKAFGVTVGDLVAWNGIDEDANLHAKMVLVAWVSPKWDADKAKVAVLDDASLVVVTRGSAEHMDLAETRTGRVRMTYVAQAKEKLVDIAKRFGMGSHDLARINRISFETILKKGESIIVYQVSDPRRSKRADEQWNKTPRGMRGKVVGAKATTTASASDQAAAKQAPVDAPVDHPADDDAKTPYDDDDKAGPVTAPSE
jgi:membrane-bound lytic murein transglycosylase D